MLLLVALAACKNDSLDVLPDHGVLRVLHAIPELGVLDLTLEDADLGRFDFNQIRGINRPGDGNHQVLIDVLLPGLGSPSQRLETLHVATAVDQETTLVVNGTLDQANVITWEQPARDWDSEVADASAPITRLEVSFGHASLSRGLLDFYLGPVGFDPADSTPMATLDYSDIQGKAEIEADNYELVVTPSGDPTTLLYRSEQLTLPAATSLLFVVYDSETVDDNGLPWLTARTLGNGFSDLRRNQEQPQFVRAVHAGRTTGAVDIVTTEDKDVIFGGLAYGDVTPYVPAPTELTSFDVTSAGNPDDHKISFSLGGAPGFSWTVMVGGTPDAVVAPPFIDDRRRVITDARFRALHGATDIGGVDLYLVAPDDDIGDFLPSIAVLAPNFSSARLAFAEGSYDLVVTLSATKDIIGGPLRISLKKNGLYTAVLSNAEEDGHVDVSFIDDDPLE
jgi:hypothetical protein